MRKLQLLLSCAIAGFMGCNGPISDVALGDCSSKQEIIVTTNPQIATDFAGGGALLASRFKSLEALKEVVQIEHFAGNGKQVPAGSEASAVHVSYCFGGHKAVGILDAGISQGDMMKAQGGGFFGQLGLIFNSPFAVANRVDLQTVMRLARRRQNFFGEGDAAFLDFAEHMVDNITTPESAFLVPQDTSEKGYLNTFNHVTAQAFITSFFSEEVADFVGDVHERHNMPELVTGVFSEEQLINKDQNPIDNYVDIVNNEWGQELGKQLKEKYQIRRETWWTADLLANYLNDIQAYFCWAMQIGFRPFRPEDEVVFRFTQKINYVMEMKGMEG